MFDLSKIFESKFNACCGTILRNDCSSILSGQEPTQKLTYVALCQKLDFNETMNH